MKLLREIKDFKELIPLTIMNLHVESQHLYAVQQG